MATTTKNDRKTKKDSGVKSEEMSPQELAEHLEKQISDLRESTNNDIAAMIQAATEDRKALDRRLEQMIEQNNKPAPIVHNEPTKVEVEPKDKESEGEESRMEKVKRTVKPTRKAAAYGVVGYAGGFGTGWFARGLL